MDILHEREASSIIKNNSNILPFRPIERIIKKSQNDSTMIQMRTRISFEILSVDFKLWHFSFNFSHSGTRHAVDPTAYVSKYCKQIKRFHHSVSCLFRFPFPYMPSIWFVPWWHHDERIIITVKLRINLFYSFDEHKMKLNLFVSLSLSPRLPHSQFQAFCSFTKRLCSYSHCVVCVSQACK